MKIRSTYSLPVVGDDIRFDDQIKRVTKLEKRWGVLIAYVESLPDKPVYWRKKRKGVNGLPRIKNRESCKPKTT